MNHLPASPAKPKGDILIVDDMPDNLRLLSAMLQTHGYEVRKSINGPLAIKAAQLAPPDLILLDINMPEMNGYQVCQTLVADGRTCNIPVIFISALGEALDKVRAFEAGGVDYITKPFQLPEVLARIENQLTIRQLQKQLLLQAQQLQEKNCLLEAEVEERQRAEAALRQANLELQRLATMDGLTGVANRRQFDDYLYQEWRRSRREGNCLSLVLCDVDFFKAFNDAYGHQAGDDCLRRLARALERSIWRPADLVARYGGEEFVLVLPATDACGAVAIAERIRQNIEALQIPHQCSQVHHHVTLSIGIASQSATEISVDELVARADSALYQAKNRGRNCTFVNDTTGIEQYVG